MIVLDSEAPIPLYMQIYSQFREQILKGELPEGGRLPSTRSLSDTLKVSRNTVEGAYQQLLSEGYITSRRGSSYRVEKLDGALAAKWRIKDGGDTVGHDLQPADTGGSDEYKYQFEYGKLAADDFPMKQWRRISNKCLGDLNAETLAVYGNGKGSLEFRKEIMKHIAKSRGVACHPEQIIVGTGIDYCLSLLCQLFRLHTDQAALEDPGFVWARHIFQNNGYKVIPVGLDKDGIMLEELERSSAKMAYVTPSHQFPMGTAMPIRRRMGLLDWADRHNGIIIEDDYDSELRYNSKPLPSIQSIDSKGVVVYIGTFSKSLSPSLRVNYMVLPLKWMEEYDRRFGSYQSPVPVMSQRILEHFMQMGHWERHLRIVTHSYKRKRDRLVRALQEQLEDTVLVHGQNAGLHILLESRCGLTEAEMIGRAKSRGILVNPVSRFWMRPERYSGNMVMLGFGGMSEEDIAEGIKELKEAWR